MLSLILIFILSVIYITLTEVFLLFDDYHILNTLGVIYSETH